MRKPYYEQTSEERRADNLADRAYTKELQGASKEVIGNAEAVGSPEAHSIAASATGLFYSSMMVDELRAIRNELADIREALNR